MKKIIKTAGILVVSLSLATNAYAINDIDKHWAKKDIEYLVEKNIMSGYDDDSFKPAKEIQRAEFLKMVNNVFENNEVVDIDFTDVGKDQWYYGEVQKAIKAGYVGGYDDGSFRPKGKLDRQETSKILAIALGIDDSTPSKNSSFKDDKDINQWAKPYVEIMVDKGYLKGYEDNTFRPKNKLTRSEAAKILAEIDRDIQIEKQIQKEKEDKEKDPKPVKKIYSVQVSTFGDKSQALGLQSKLKKEGYKNSFVAKDNYGIFFVIADDFTIKAEGDKLKLDLERKGYKPFVLVKDFRDYEIVKAEDPKPEEPKPEPPKESSSEKLSREIKDLPEPASIQALTEKLLLSIDSINNQYTKLNDEDKKKIKPAELNKVKSVEKKVNSLKTNIKSPTKTTVEKAQEWARSRGSHERFVNIAPEFWKYGELTGINPEILYAQAAKETNFGKYTGSVKPEMNNWAGIKTNNPKGDSTYDHEIFATPEDGVRAQFNHMGIYVGTEPVGEPHPRWHITSTVSWKGTVLKVEDLGGKWAPSRDYGISIMRDYVSQIYRY